jgi:hypothetical protein
MSPNLVLGPLLRYAGASDATVWVETDASYRVEELVGGSSHHSHTFEVEGRHYTLGRITGLKSGASHEHAVTLVELRKWHVPLLKRLLSDKEECGVWASSPIASASHCAKPR